MYSFDYVLAHTRGVRKILRWVNTQRISRLKLSEQEKMKSDKLHLSNFENKVFSQNGEDGIIEEIFKRIGTTNKFFVEFGVENGNECNSRQLLENKSWSGLWMDGSDKNVAWGLKKFSHLPINFQSTFVTAENIEGLLEKFEVPQEPDLFVIDIDGNDFWVWKTIEKYRPRVMILEYNASHEADVDWVMPYNSTHVFDGTSYFGASLLALDKLGKEKGYTLVNCDSRGVNAFFVRNDLLGNHFSHTDLGSKYFYMSPKYNCFFYGHPKGKGPWIKGEFSPVH